MGPNMHRTSGAILILVSGLLAAPLDDTAKVQWLSTHMVDVRSINPTDDFRDLEPLKKAIGDARIVQLGEHNHGAGATFYAKQRVVRFLHEQMGFDVLAWEGNLYSCEQMQVALESAAPTAEIPGMGLPTIWAKAAATPSLFEYARSTKLRMAGFDIQLNPATRAAYVNKLQEFFTSAEDRAAIADSSFAKLTSRVQYGSIIHRILVNLADYEKRQFNIARHMPALELMNQRDAAMAENVVWLANERYKGRKIIIWAHNFHTLRHPEKLYSDQNADVPRYRPMADRIYEALNNRVYTIAFLDYQGSVGSPWQGPVRQEPVPLPGSVEALLHTTGKPYGFLDMRLLPKDHWLRSPHVARPGFYQQTVTSTWPDNFDGIFFIDKMFPGDVTI
jgi:erythromycin esterase